MRRWEPRIPRERSPKVRHPWAASRNRVEVQWPLITLIDTRGHLKPNGLASCSPGVPSASECSPGTSHPPHDPRLVANPTGVPSLERSRDLDPLRRMPVFGRMIFRNPIILPSIILPSLSCPKNKSPMRRASHGAWKVLSLIRASRPQSRAHRRVLCSWRRSSTWRSRPFRSR